MKLHDTHHRVMYPVIDCNRVTLLIDDTYTHLSFLTFYYSLNL